MKFTETTQPGDLIGTAKVIAVRRMKLPTPFADKDVPVVFGAQGNTKKPRGALIRKLRSKTEQLFADELERQWLAKEILDYRYEGIRFQLADVDELQRTYTPDWLVRLPDGRFRCIEVKHWREMESDQDTRTIFAWANQQYGGPVFEFCAFRMIQGGGWKEIWR